MRVPAKVLVVDDEAIMCRSCLRVLAADGHDVSIAQTGEEALRKIESDRFDVALLDLRIPGSGGLTVLRAIRKGVPAEDFQTVIERIEREMLENALKATGANKTAAA